MKIIFDLRKVGLGNQGGSSTLVKSGNTLVDMGHEVYFIDSGKNQHTWSKLKADHIVCRNEKIMPNSDFIIATGYKSVAPTFRAPDRCGIKVHYIRGWETWVYPEQKIVKNILKIPTIKIVNSICLQKKLKHYKVDSYVIRPGYDFEDLYPMNIRGTKNIVLGGLCHLGKHRKTKRTDWLFTAAHYLKNRFNNVKLWLFGSDAKPSIDIIDKYIRNPSITEKNKFYNEVDIWLAPASLEGLHLPPAEAMMTGCLVVTTKNEMSGTQDYVRDGITGLRANDNIDSFINCIGWLILNKKIRESMSEDAIKQISELGSRKENMQKLIDLFEVIKQSESI